MPVRQFESGETHVRCRDTAASSVGLGFGYEGEFSSAFRHLVMNQ